MIDFPSGASPQSNGGGDRRVPLAIVDLVIIVLTKLAIDACVIHGGFTHVSDDDYARTVISEQLVHAPRIDPSGTSWLPLPFWITGAAMAVAGRSLETARGVAIALGAVAVAAPYAAMRAVRVTRPAALAATLIAMVLPWNAWLGVASVPEGWVGALVAAGAIAIGSGTACVWAAAALAAASLARYEAWPACAVAFAGFAWRAARGRDRRSAIAYAMLATAGPLLWMAWNAHAHGSAFHFFTRVARFRQTAGGASLPILTKLLGYPRALVEQTPEAAALGVLGAAGLVCSASIRTRWSWAAAAAAAVLAFLVIGDVGDGAPTHHAARALAPVWWILVGIGVDTAFSGVTRLARPGAPRVGAVCAAATVIIVWCATLPSRWLVAPGKTDLERRDTQIARGLDMRLRRVIGADIAPCAFEHFALIAAWGEPERARIGPSSKEAPTDACPRVTESPEALR